MLAARQVFISETLLCEQTGSMDVIVLVNDNFQHLFNALCFPLFFPDKRRKKCHWPIVLCRATGCQGRQSAIMLNTQSAVIFLKKTKGNGRNQTHAGDKAFQRVGFVLV